MNAKLLASTLIACLSTFACTLPTPDRSLEDLKDGDSTQPASPSDSPAKDVRSPSNPRPTSNFSVELGGVDYAFSTQGSGGTWGGGWTGATLDAITYEGNPSSGWPKSNPRLTINVLFTGFLASTGFEPGTYDLADAARSGNLVVTFQASRQGEVPVGGTVAYADYSSSSSVEGAGSSEANVPSPAAKGTVTVGGFKSSGMEMDYDITLTNVVLPVVKSDPSFPQTVTIKSAHLVAKPEQYQ